MAEPPEGACYSPRMSRGARAKNQGAPVEEVGKVYALEISQKAPAGTWFLGENGNWVRKDK